MSPAESHRIRFHAWLVANGLDEATADAILATMPPYDWHQLATKADIADLRAGIEGRFDGINERFTGIEGRFDGINERFTGIEGRFDGINERFTGIDSRFSGVEGQLGDIRQEMAGPRADVRTMLLAMVGFMLTVLLTAGGFAVTYWVA